jgi:hypothetical protein
VEEIIQEKASNKVYVNAIGQYIERYYPYRTEAVWSIILQQEKEELQKSFFNRGAIHNVIIANNIDTQYPNSFYLVQICTR